MLSLFLPAESYINWIWGYPDLRGRAYVIQLAQTNWNSSFFQLHTGEKLTYDWPDFFSRNDSACGAPVVSWFLQLKNKNLNKWHRWLIRKFAYIQRFSFKASNILRQNVMSEMEAVPEVLLGCWCKQEWCAWGKRVPGFVKLELRLLALL